MSNHTPESNHAPDQSQSNTPAPDTFALDYHTRQFFDPSEWEGAVEATFHLDTPGLCGHRFEGRIALLCDGNPVIVMRAAEGSSTYGNEEGATLLKRPPYPLDPDEIEPSMRGHHWAQWLGLHVYPKPNCPLPILPNIASNSGLMRLHFDAASGFGAQVWSVGHGYLFDLRDVESAEKRHRPHVDMEDLLGVDGMRTLGAMDGREFHRAMDGMFRDAGSSLHQVVRFYAMSDDERSLEVLGCDYRMLQRTLEGIKCALTMALGPGGALAGCERATWHPWHMNPDIAVAANVREQWWEDMVAPVGMAEMLERVCAATGCRLRLERMAGDSEGQGSARIVDAPAVAQEWANELFVSGTAASGHEAVEATVRLREIMEGSD